MTITLNGDPHDTADNPTIRELLDELDLAPQRVAVEVNGELVRRGLFDEHRLNGGDKVEVVTLVGGG